MVFAMVLYLRRCRERGQGEFLSSPLLVPTLKIVHAQSLISLSRWLVGESRWSKFDKASILILKGPRGTLDPLFPDPPPFLPPLA